MMSPQGAALKRKVFVHRGPFGLSVGSYVSKMWFRGNCMLTTMLNFKKKILLSKKLGCHFSVALKVISVVLKDMTLKTHRDFWKRLYFKVI